jgi:heptosyltransferase-3
MTEKILVIHQGALGDVILSFPALVSLKVERGASVDILCKDQVGRMAHEFGIVDARFPVESARFSALFSKDMNPDMRGFVSPYDTILLIGFSGDLEMAMKQHYRGQSCRITPRPPAEEQTHVAIHLTRQLQKEGLLRKVGNCGLGKPDLLLPRNARIQHGQSKIEQGVSLFDWPAGHEDESEPSTNRLLIHPGAGSKRKRWPLKHFVQLADAVSQMAFADVVFLLGPAETELLPLVKKEAGGGFRVCQAENLAQVTALMKASRCFVGNDSGLTHLAAFWGLPTVAIFGPSSPRRWSPVGVATQVLRGDADCLPCFELADTNCDDPHCLKGVSVDMVLEAIEGFRTV